MSCFNVKILSYISAAWHFLYCIAFIIFAIVAAVLVNSPSHTDTETIYPPKVNVLLAIGLILSAVGIALLVTLVVGIRKNRRLLITIYLYVTYTFMGICVVLIIAETIINVMWTIPVRYILTELFIQLGLMALEIFLLIPIILLHRGMSRTPIQPTTRYRGIPTSSYGEY